MNELVANFEKRFAGGATIRAALRQPVDRFSVTVLFGPSGCGKTTVLRSLAGLERPENGTIRFGDEVWLDSARRVHVGPQARGVGFLFQEYALFPHLSVADNIAFGLRKAPSEDRRARVAEMISLFELSGLEQRYPRQISGGQQQRVALARVLARRPRLLLLDEPLAALDNQLREQLRGELRKLLTSFGIPVLLVTHDRTEAMSLADEVVVMVQGEARQQGPVADVFSRPLDDTVARIVGVESLIPAQVVDCRDGLATLDVGGVRLLAAADVTVGQQVLVCIRGEDVSLVRGPAPASSVRNQVPARVNSIVREGPLVRVMLDCGFQLTALVTRPACDELGLQPGEQVVAMIKAPAMHVVPRGAR